MRKSSENKMLSNSASKLKLEWMMLSKEDKRSYIMEFIVIGWLIAMMIMIGVDFHVNPDLTLEDLAQCIALISLCFVVWIMTDLFKMSRESGHRAQRKKEGLRPEWTNQDFDLLDEDIEELYERVKALESRRY